MRPTKRLLLLAGLTAVTGSSAALQAPAPTSCGACGGPVSFPPGAASGVSLPGANLASVRGSLDSAAGEVALGATCAKNNAHPSGSDDGNVVAWVTRAPVVDGSNPNTPGKTQVYVRKMDGSLASTMASAPVIGTTIQGFAEMPRLSGDGDWVAFTSTSRKLTPEDDAESPKYQDVFLYHVPTGAVERVSETPVTRDGGNGKSGGVPGISTDGRYVVFQSEADDLQSFADPCDVVPTLYIAAAGNGKTRRKPVVNIYLRDRGADLFDDVDDCIEWISPGIDDITLVCEQPDGPSFTPTVSANGCLVAFESEATNLLASGPVTGAPRQIYLRDRTTDTTVLVSVDTGGGPGDGKSQRASISGDGKWVVFESAASDLVAGDTNGDWDVFAYEVASGTVTRLSLDGTGSQLSFGSIAAETSDQGRFVTYTRVGEGANAYELWVVDRDPDDDGVFSETPSTKQVSVDSAGGVADGWSGGWPYALSSDGKYSVFMSIASDLAGTDTNCVGTGCAPGIFDCDDGRDIYRQPLY